MKQDTQRSKGEVRLGRVVLSRRNGILLLPKGSVGLGRWGKCSYNKGKHLLLINHMSLMSLDSFKDAPIPELYSPVFPTCIDFRSRLQHLNPTLTPNLPQTNV